MEQLQLSAQHCLGISYTRIIFNRKRYDHSKIVKPQIVSIWLPDFRIWQSYTNDIYFNRTSMKKKTIHLKLNQIQPKLMKLRTWFQLKILTKLKTGIQLKSLTKLERATPVSVQASINPKIRAKNERASLQQAIWAFARVSCWNRSGKCNVNLQVSSNKSLLIDCTFLLFLDDHARLSRDCSLVYNLVKVFSLIISVVKLY